MDSRLRGNDSFKKPLTNTENGDIKPEQMHDPQGINLGVAFTRDVARTAMQWAASQYAGFSSVEPWLPLSADYQTRNVVVQEEQADSMLAFYRKLLWLRTGSAVLQGGSYRPLALHEACFAYVRELDGERLLVVLNFAGKPCQLDLGDVDGVEGNGRFLLSTHPDREGVVRKGLDLRPFEGILIAL